MTELTILYWFCWHCWHVLRSKTVFCTSVFNRKRSRMKRVQELSWQLQQRVNIHFCVKMGWTFAEIRTALHTCFPQVLGDRCIHKWIAQFRAGRDRIVDKVRAPRAKSGRSTRNIRKVEDIVAADCRVTLKSISVKAGISCTTAQCILKKDLKLTKRTSTFVPAVLTDAHKQKRRDVCNLFTRIMSQNLRVFRNVVTMDKSWIYIWDPTMRNQSKEWLRLGEPVPQIPRKTIATAKVMLVSFFDCTGMVYYEFVQRPQTVNQQTFRAIFRRFDAAHHRRRPHSTVRGRHFLHLDNTPSHNATLTLALIDQLGWTRLPQPAYSPDLAPSDFWLCHRLKRNLRGVRFPSLEHLKEAVAEEIANIAALEYRHSIMVSWPKRWRLCLQEQGNYFEGRQ